MVLATVVANLTSLDEGIRFGSVTPASTELAAHCLDSSEHGGAPASVLAVLMSISDMSQASCSRSEVFGALASEVERIYLADIIAVSLAAATGCTAVEERFYDPDPGHRRPCTAVPGLRTGRIAAPRPRLAG
ncbi:MAG: hypothetical protein R2710_08480 [Acidimicrobiales bacterium]